MKKMSAGKSKRTLRRTSGTSRPATLAEILQAANEAPEALARWLAGRPGRWPKWTGTDYVRELTTAADVERERIQAGIPEDRKRTPGEVYRAVAKKHRISFASVRRFHAKHRDDAVALARFFYRILPERQRQLPELVGIYGSAVACLPMREIARIYRERNALRPSEIPAFDSRVNQFLSKYSEN